MGDEYARTDEVRLPLRSNPTTIDGRVFDGFIRLSWKRRDGLRIYTNEDATGYTRHSPPISFIRENQLSALRAGVGTDSLGLVPSGLWIPLHAVGYEQYRAAVVRASTRIIPINNSNYP